MLFLFSLQTIWNTTEVFAAASPSFFEKKDILPQIYNLF